MTDYNAPAPIGHNEPPSDDLNEQARAAIERELERFIPVFQKRIDSASRAKADSLETVKLSTDLVALLASSVQSVDRAHSAAKAPYLDAGRIVDGKAAEWREKLVTARDAVNAGITAWQNAEKERIKKLREAERAAEAADPEPTATNHADVDAKLVVTRGDFGAAAKLEAVLVIDKVDVKKLPKRFLERPKILAAIEAEVRTLHKAGETVTGVTTHITHQSRVRKGG